jgi:hypothetical protein
MAAEIPSPARLRSAGDLAGDGGGGVGSGVEKGDARRGKGKKGGGAAGGVGFSAAVEAVVLHGRVAWADSFLRVFFLDDNFLGWACVYASFGVNPKPRPST